MCGIAGIVAFQQDESHRDKLSRMLDLLAHRGRDQHGIAELDHVFLGHRRLSIIDLHTNAAQPMWYADKKYCLSYNGEIYNYLELRTYLQKKFYQFQTHSDTEVILAAYDHWGTDCVQKFNGMFAFALWDDAKKYLFCARDHLGIKPFYYHKTAKQFAFASEAIALTPFNDKRLNQDALYAYLMSMYVPGELSIFADVKKLAPGHIMLVHANGNIHTAAYWSLDSFEGKSVTAGSLDEIRHLVRQAVYRQLRSDVPVGGFLSGGIDSGLITALAAPHTHYHTYSVAYEGAGDNELPYAKQLAHQYHTQHQELMISATCAVQTLDKALLQISEPIADPSVVAAYLLSELAASDGVKVLLNGTGGDEVFAGYSRYSGQLSLKRRMLLRMPSLLRHVMGYLPLQDKLKSRIRSPNLDMMLSTGGSYTLATRVAQQPTVFATFIDQLLETISITCHQRLPLLYQQMLFDLQYYLPDQLLFLLDQTTMAHTVEGRVPLLDIDLIQAAFKFNAHEHLQKRQNKAILKQVALPYLGAAYVERRKQGFGVRTTWWVQQHYTRFLDVISSLESNPYFAGFKIDAFNSPSALSDAQANDMYLLYCFSQWHERIKML